MDPSLRTAAINHGLIVKPVKPSEHLQNNLQAFGVANRFKKGHEGLGCVEMILKWIGAGEGLSQVTLALHSAPFFVL